VKAPESSREPQLSLLRICAGGGCGRLGNSIEGSLDGRGRFRGNEALKGKNDAWLLSGRIRDTKATEQERGCNHMTHPPYLELGPVAGVDPTAKFFQHVAAKFREYRRHRIVSRQNPAVMRFTKEGHEGSGLAIHMEDTRG
jgi:hypothetical protein